MEFKFELYDQDSQPTLMVRTRTRVEKLPELLGKVYAELFQHLQTYGEQPSGAPYVAYYNLDMNDLDLEIGFTIHREIAGEGEIQIGELPAGKYASCLYKGPYQEMAPAYNALTQFVKDQGLTPSGVSYEFYLNSPQEVSQQELLTQIAFPILQS